MVVSHPLSDHSLPDDPVDAFSLDPDRREPTMTLAGWRRFVETPAAHVELLPEKRWVALSGRDKEAYDEARLNYHSERSSWRPPPFARSPGRAGC